MTDHGILMNGDMVRAYLEGRKWMTRRTRGLDAINQRPSDWEFKGIVDGRAEFICKPLPSHPVSIKTPYGLAGEMLWFKETYAIICNDYPCDHEDDAAHYAEYRADTENLYPGDWSEEEAKGNDEAPKWRSSMFMARKWSRITVPVVNVRVERLQDITAADAFAEGVRADYLNQPPDWMDVDRYHELWNSINAKRGFSWDSNPWVWVYEFPKYSKLEG